MPATRVSDAIAYINAAAQRADANHDGILEANELAGSDETLKEFTRASLFDTRFIQVDVFEWTLTNAQRDLTIVDANGDGFVDEHEATGISMSAQALLGAARSLATRPGVTPPEFEVTPRRATDSDSLWPVLGADLRLGAGVASALSSGDPTLALTADMSVLGLLYTSENVSLSLTPHVGAVVRADFGGASDAWSISGFAAAELAVGGRPGDSRRFVSGRIGAGVSFADDFAPHLSAGLDVQIVGIGLTTGVSASVDYMYTDNEHVVTLGVRGGIDVLGALASE